MFLLWCFPSPTCPPRCCTVSTYPLFPSLWCIHVASFPALWIYVYCCLCYGLIFYFAFWRVPLAICSFFRLFSCLAAWLSPASLGAFLFTAFSAFCSRWCLALSRSTSFFVACWAIGLLVPYGGGNGILSRSGSSPLCTTCTGCFFFVFCFRLDLFFEALDGFLYVLFCSFYSFWFSSDYKVCLVSDILSVYVY